MGQVLKLSDYQAPKEVVVSKPKKQINISYELSFIKNLLIWMGVGAVLAFFLPMWVITTLLIVMVYVDGKFKSIKASKEGGLE